MVSGKVMIGMPNLITFRIHIESIHILNKLSLELSYGLEISFRICKKVKVSGILALKSGLSPLIASYYFMLSIENIQVHIGFLECPWNCLSCARIYRPRFRENKPKDVYKFGHWTQERNRQNSIIRHMAMNDQNFSMRALAYPSVILCWALEHPQNLTLEYILYMVLKDPEIFFYKLVLIGPEFPPVTAHWHWVSSSYWL